MRKEELLQGERCGARSNERCSGCCNERCGGCSNEREVVAMRW
jgi:hypothetical protein